MRKQTSSSFQVSLVLGGVALVIAAAACGGGNNTTGGGAGGGTASHGPASSSHVTTGMSSSSGGPVMCTTTTEITVGAFHDSGSDGTAGLFSAAPMPEMGDMADKDLVSLEFYSSSFDASDDGEKTGTFDLTMNNDDNYATCSRCVSVLVDPTSTSGKRFFLKSGTITVDATSDQINGKVKATLTDVTLIEVTVDSMTFESTPVDNPTCLHFATADVAYTKQAAPAAWVCPAAFFDDGDCDCGCGVLDSDCADATVGSCHSCGDMGTCNTDAMGNCPGNINPTNNAVCM